MTTPDPRPIIVAATAALTVLALALRGDNARVSCPTESRLGQVAEVLLGRNVGAKLAVSEPDFANFLDQDVTPRFPSGYTVIDTTGQYASSATGQIIKEPGKLLLIAFAAVDDEIKVQALAAAYKRRFNQESVGIITRPSCIAF